MRATLQKSHYLGRRSPCRFHNSANRVGNSRHRLPTPWWALMYAAHVFKRVRYASTDSSHAFFGAVFFNLSRIQDTPRWLGRRLPQSQVNPGGFFKKRAGARNGPLPGRPHHGVPMNYHTCGAMLRPLEVVLRPPRRMIWHCKAREIPSKPAICLCAREQLA